MDEVAGGDAVGGDEDFGMEAGTEEIDGDHRRSAETAIRFERLAEQHFAALEGGMRMAANSVADDLGGDHGGETEDDQTEDRRPDASDARPPMGSDLGDDGDLTVIEWQLIGEILVFCLLSRSLPSCSNDAEVFDEDAAADAGEGFGSGDAFAGGGGDGVGQVAFAAEAETGDGGAVFHEDRRVHFASHVGHVIDILGVDDRRVAVVVFGAFCFLHGGEEIRAGNNRHHRHHLLFLDEGMIGIGFREEQLSAGRDRGARVFGEL